MKALWFAAVGLGVIGGWLARSGDRVIKAYGRLVIVFALIFALLALALPAHAQTKEQSAPWWATTLAVAGPLADGFSTHYAIGQSGPYARVLEGNTFYHKLFGSNVTRNEILAFKVGQAALMGALVHYQGKSNRKAAIATALITAGINFTVSALNVRNGMLARDLNRGRR